MAEGSSPVTLSWTPANFITIVLMGGLAFVIIGAVARIWQQKQQAQQAA